MRVQVARHGYGLDKLVNDRSANVRYYVAKRGYGIDVLINDENADIRELCQEFLDKQGITLEEYKLNKDYWYNKAMAK